MRRCVRLVLALCSWFAVIGATLVLTPSVPFEVAPAFAAKSYTARGTVHSIATDRMSISIAHEAIPGFMAAMTMSFEARSPEQFAGLREGDRVTFSFTVTDDARMLIDTIRSIRPR